MATVLSTLAAVPSVVGGGGGDTSTLHSSLPPPRALPPAAEKQPSSLAISSLVPAVFTAVALTVSSPSLPPARADNSAFSLYYGTAASAANYGGNSSKKDLAEYLYEVPAGCKMRLVSKVEKGTNGTDSEFYNPKKRSEKEYLTFLAGFPRLAPCDAVLNNLTLSDVSLQDLISGDDSVRSEEVTDEKGQVYYVYEIEGAGARSLISVTCAKNKLYAHLVNAPARKWKRDKQTLKHIHQSFKTVG